MRYRIYPIYILRLDLAVAIFISCIFGTTPKIAQELYNANKNLTFHAQSLFLYKKMKKKILKRRVWNLWVLKRQLSKRARYYQYNCGRSPGVWLLASSQVSLSHLYVPASRCLLRFIYSIRKENGFNEGFIIIASHLPYAVNIVSIVNIDNIAEHFLQARYWYRKLGI